MKNIYKIISFTALVIAFGLFTACEFNKAEDSAKNAKPQTEIENKAEVTKAHLTIKASIDQSGNMAERKLQTDKDSVEEFCKKYVVYQVRTNYNEEGFTFQNKRYTYAELVSGVTLELAPGNWGIQLWGYYYKETTPGTSEEPIFDSNIEYVELKSGENNALNFILQPAAPSDWTTHKYNFLISVTDYTKGLYDSAELKIYNYVDYKTQTPGLTPERTVTAQCYSVSPLKTTDNTYNEYYFVITDLPASRYWIEGTLTGNSGQNKRIFCSEQMIVIAGDYIEKSYEVGRYKLNYEMSGGTVYDEYIDGFTEDTPYQYYASDMAFRLPDPVRQGYIFDGWFWNPGPNFGQEVECYQSGSYKEYKFNTLKTFVGDKTIYAKWIKAIPVNYYVEGEGFDSSVPLLTVIENKEQEISFINLMQYAKPAGYNIQACTGWYTNPEYSGSTVTSYTAAQMTDMSEINLYCFTGEKVDLQTIYGVANTYKGISHSIDLIPGGDILKPKANDIFTYTITIFANADLTLQSAIANEKTTYGYGLYTATTSDSENSFTVEAFTPKTIKFTTTFDDANSGSEDSILILLYGEKDSIKDKVISCTYSNVKVTQGASTFVLWDSAGIKDSVSLNMQKTCYYDPYYKESDTDNDGTYDKFIYELPRVSDSTYTPDVGNPVTTYDYDKLIVPQTDSGVDPDVDYYTNPGFAFLGWYDDTECTTPSQDVQVSESENGGNPLPSKTYYSKWGLYAKPVTSEYPSDSYPTEYADYFVAHIPYKKLFEVRQYYNTMDFYQDDKYSIKLKGKSNFDYSTDQFSTDKLKIRFTDVDGTLDYITSYNENVSSFETNTVNECSFDITIPETKYNVDLLTLYVDILFPKNYVRDSSTIELISSDKTELILSDWEFTFEEAKKDPISLNDTYMLYEKYTGEPYDTSDDSLTITTAAEIPYNKNNAYSVQSTIDYSKIDSVIDVNKDVYVLDFDTEGNFFVVKNGNMLFSQSSLAAIGVTDKLSISKLYVGCEANYLYAAGDNGYGATDFIRYNLADDSIDYGKFIYRFEKDSASYEMTEFAVLSFTNGEDNDGRIFASFVPKKKYVTEIASFDKRYIAAADFTVSNNKIKFNPYLPTKSFVSFADLFGTEADSIGSKLSSNIGINDMQIVNSDNDDTYYLYVLFGIYEFKERSDYNYSVESYGFISRINVTKTIDEQTAATGLAWDTQFGTNGILGLNEAALNFSLTSPTDNYVEPDTDKYYYRTIKTTSNDLASDFKNYLVNPQKFVAIEPKKLIFVDDGSFILGNYVHELNRIITLNLLSLSSTNPFSQEERITTQFGNKIGKTYCGYKSAYIQ